MDDLLKHKEVDVPGGLTLHICNQQPSITSVLRAVKREEHGIFNCISSIVDDSEFVQQVRTQFAAFPLLTNLRCGSWYAPDPDGTCYFKSTDGHIGQWSFSTVRLNLQVAELALCHGGVCIVDSTRRGKRFPDALSKTIPIWAAVINQALVSIHKLPQQQGVGVHLPPWIPKNEINEINKRMGTWVESFLALGLDLTKLEALLRHPLQCVWISQDDDEWMKHSLNYGSNSYAHTTPIILVNASLPNFRQRRRLVVPRIDVDVMYEYIPGAGDDEETWAQGLTPSIMWAHLEEILQHGPHNANSIAARIKRQHSWGQGDCDLCIARSGRSPMQDVNRPANAWKLQWIGDPVSLGIVKSYQTRLCDAGNEMKNESLSLSIDDKALNTVVVWLLQEESSNTSSLTSQCVDSEANHFELKTSPQTHVGKDKKFPEQLRGCIEFVSKALVTGANVLVKTDGRGVSVAGAIVLACMIACYEIEQDCENDKGELRSQREGRKRLHWCGPAKQYLDGTALLFMPATDLTTGGCKLNRKLMKRYLAILSANYPQLIVSKGLLRQVFNVFAVRNEFT